MAAKRSTSTASPPPSDAPTFASVSAELDAALGKPVVKRGLRLYRPGADAERWIARVHAAGGAASMCEASSKSHLLVANGPPSMLMDYCTWVKWQSKSARNALDKLHADAGLRISEMKYTHFTMHLDRVPRDLEQHAKRFAKVVMNGDAEKISAALAKKKWKTG